MRSANQLPVPNADELQISDELTTLLRRRIDSAGGWISFSEYMRAVLYEPGLGYYAAGSVKLGSSGDFVTAPELGDFFAAAVAKMVAGVVVDMPRPHVLEVGAGTGALAAELLQQFDSMDLPSVSYGILEPSPDLRARQVELLAQFGDRVQWYERLEDASIDGVIIANEVADALPVERFVKRQGGLQRLGVSFEEGRFQWREGSFDDLLKAQLETIERQFLEEWPEGYISEFSALQGPWIRSLAAALNRGAIFIVDYGMPQRDFYSPARNSGTMMCHFRHRAHDNPFLYPGLQDVTAWIDFSALAQAGDAAGLTLAGFTTQGHWLLETLAQGGFDLSGHSAQALAALKTLLLPGEMGERFKAMLLSKNTEAPALAGRDMRSWL